MTDKLDDLLNDFEQKSKKKKEDVSNILEEKKEKKETFNENFGILMTKTIKPTIKLFFDKLKKHKYKAESIKETSMKYVQYKHEKYLVEIGKNTLVFTVVGNYDNQKVFIYTEHSEGSSSIKNENSCDLTDVTPDLLTSILTDAVEKILK